MGMGTDMGLEVSPAQGHHCGVAPVNGAQGNAAGLCKEAKSFGLWVGPGSRFGFTRKAKEAGETPPQAGAKGNSAPATDTLLCYSWPGN